MVEVFGGFGNQIFQLNFAQFLKSYGFEVEINIRDFKRVAKENPEHLTVRRLVVSPNHFDHKVINNRDYYKYKFRRNTRDYRLTNKLFKNEKKFLLVTDKNFKIENLKKNNYFIGYWQNINLLDKNKDYLIKSLSNNQNINAGIKKEKNNKTMIHVRRNDYLRIKEELPKKYYDLAFSYLTENEISQGFDIFTDDYEWCKNNKLFKNAGSIFSSSDSPSNTIKSFSKMLIYKNYIIANSTFSLLAAYFGESKESKVIYPDPWFKKRGYNDELFNKNWIKISYD